MASTQHLTATARTSAGPLRRILVYVTTAGLALSSLSLASIPAPAAATPLGVSQAAPAQPTAPTAKSLTTTGLRVNGLVNPLGIDGIEAPIFSWSNTADGRAVSQTAYEIRVATAASPGTDLWSSGKVDSTEQLNVAYEGPDLLSQTAYTWQVRTWGTGGVASPWSERGTFETALLSSGEWQGQWIGGPDPAAQLARWKDYTVSTDFTLDNLVFGLYARAKDANNSYMWQLSLADGTPRFRPHKKVNGAFSLIENKDISSTISAADLKKGTHNLTVTFTGTSIVTLLDGTEIDRRTDSTHAAGYVGFRQSVAAEGKENATIKKIVVTSPTEGVLLSTDFTGGQNPFNAGTVTPGGLQLVAPVEPMYRADPSDPVLRKEFSVGKTVTNARIYASARGVYELSLNGTKVGDQQLAPGWTNYNKRIDYQTYDVTSLLKNGVNAWGAMLADGWYSGHIASFGPNQWGSRNTLIAQLRIDYSDGSHDLVRTDSSWKAAPGPLVESDMIMGETYDARLDQAGWQLPGFDDSDWTASGVAATPADAKSTTLLEPQSDEPVRVTDRLTPISRTEASPGVWIYDLGQNMVGVADLTLTGTANSTATIRYGEMLNPDGTLYTANLRSAKATDYYTFAKDGTATYTPKFTFHGYRYLEVTGTSTPPTVDQITGVVWGSDLATTGTLSSSSAMLNQLQSNITWGQRGNFLSIPTDTPARDERLGWTGDINVFAPTASYNKDTLTFLGKWLGDLRDSQATNGDLPGVSPFENCCGGGTGWSDAGITVPYTLWSTYGDTKVITDNYDMMTKFMTFVETQAGPSRIRNHGGYGDWLHLDDGTSSSLLGTAYYAFVAGQLSEMAAAIGKTADATRYAELSADVRDTFADRFITSDGTVQGNSQTGYAMAIGMGLVPENLLAAVGDKFVAKIASRDYHLSTGFLGTPWLLPALTKTGHQDVAYRLLNNDTFPSWGYEVASGATTMWERWDSLKPDGSFGDVGMNSFNHYAYGAVGDWMYQNIGGIQSTGTAYKTFDIAPSIGGGLTHGTGTFESVYGTISSEWATTAGGTTLKATVPVSTTATVKIPALNRWSVTEGGRPLAEAPGVTLVSEAAGVVTLLVGSGTYEFSSDPANSGLTVALDGAADTLPGTTVKTTLTVTNTGSTPVTGFSARLQLPAGIEAKPAVPTIATLAPGASQKVPVTVSIPVATAAGDLTMGADVSATVGGEARTFSVSQKLVTVLPAVTFETLTVAVPAGDSPEVAVATGVVKNAAASPLTGRFVVDAPDGWPAPMPSRTVTVKPGETATSDVAVTIPLGYTAGKQSLSARFVHDTTDLATASAEFELTLATPPANATDHIDLGESASENAHRIATSGNGGATVEAGLTRRYSGLTTVGSWFSFDMKVTPGQPFLIRGIETFDQAQVKSYDILVNDQVIESRLYTRSAGGAGLATYQILVPDASLTSSGTVNIRMRYNGLGSHDPSLADVWTLPVPGDTVAPSVVVDVSNPGTEGWYLGGATATLRASDARSGVTTVEYKVDTDAGPGSWKTYGNPVTLPEGASTLHYRATDVAGNVSAEQEETLRVDGTAPTAWAWLTEAGRLSSVAQDGGSGVDHLEYTLNGETWHTSLSRLVGAAGAGATLDALEVRAVDVAGNRGDALPVTASATAPTLSIYPGHTALVESGGFKAGQKVRVELHSEPIVLGTATADAFGVVSLAATIPADFEPGEHSLVLVPLADPVGPVDPTDPTDPGTTPGGGTGTGGNAGGVITIPADVLSNTGAEILPVVTIAALLLLLGGGMVALRYRSRRREADGS